MDEQRIDRLAKNLAVFCLDQEDLSSLINKHVPLGEIIDEQEEKLIVNAYSMRMFILDYFFSVVLKDQNLRGELLQKVADNCFPEVNHILNYMMQQYAKVTKGQDIKNWPSLCAFVFSMESRTYGSLLFGGQEVLIGEELFKITFDKLAQKMGLEIKIDMFK